MIQSISGMGGGMRAMQGAQGGSIPQKAIEKFDADGDGALNATELQALSDMKAEKMGGSGPSGEEILNSLDTDGDGIVSFAEFQAGRPEGGNQAGGNNLMMPAGRGYGQMAQMDLSALFSQGEDEEPSVEESLYSYA